MTRTGQAVVTVGKEFSVGEYTVPDPAPGTVLLRQELGGICGTDLHNWQKGIQRATMLGHENVGVIDALGKGVTTDYNGTPIREGDRVVFHPRNTVMASGHGAAGEPFSGGLADNMYQSAAAS
ncbi:MAG: alcohol dehydrogenase catalytic domain-containing protein [Caldilineaceae bacterium SB0675_bin_29]|uniref:Alcohol dehydrogenase catalytic domain-containing protein n=1 Tax=Caldilineaceae bacterium SB0675_bin_29 TaxID=2605266 RepID=A0A6B1FUI4_9CHLR|nr:alcohol dehydrogenase catalytic domain-containing protein [Caldilineaceae bacterium SB0675_bin_29]